MIEMTLGIGLGLTAVTLGITGLVRLRKLERHMNWRPRLTIDDIPDGSIVPQDTPFLNAIRGEPK